MPVIIMFVSENRLIENDLVLPLSSRSTRRCSKGAAVGIATYRIIAPKPILL